MRPTKGEGLVGIVNRDHSQKPSRHIIRDSHLSTAQNEPCLHAVASVTMRSDKNRRSGGAGLCDCPGMPKWQATWHPRLGGS